MVFLIAYDLKSPNDTSLDYQRVIGGIKSIYGSWCHLEKSVFLVDTISTSAAIRDSMKPYLHRGDSLFVSRLAAGWASYALGDERNTWLKARTF
jgi:hypothetical protein